MNVCNSGYNIELSLTSGRQCILTGFRSYDEAWEWLLSAEAKDMRYVLSSIVDAYMSVP